jgi:predicted ArsR family transcriptional regulator
MEEQRETYELETLEQMRALADPLRMRIAEVIGTTPKTATQIGATLDLPANKVHYHVRELERVGLARIVETREKGGILEKYYQLIARQISAPHSLFQSVPSDESLAVLNEALQSVVRQFMRVFARRVQEPEGQADPLTLQIGNYWMTGEECRETSRQIEALLKPYEERRGLPDERQRTFVSIAHTTPPAAEQEENEMLNLAPGPEPTVSEDRHQAAAERRSSGAGRPKKRRIVVAGAISYTRADLEQVVADGHVLDITLLGLATFADDITPDLVDRAVARFRHRGVLHASPDVSAALKQKEG